MAESGKYLVAKIVGDNSNEEEVRRMKEPLKLRILWPEQVVEENCADCDEHKLMSRYFKGGLRGISKKAINNAKRLYNRIVRERIPGQIQKKNLQKEGKKRHYKETHPAAESPEPQAGPSNAPEI